LINPLNTTVPAPLTGRPGGNPLPAAGSPAQQIPGTPPVATGQISGGQFTAAITAGLVDLRPAGETLQKLAALVQINLSELLSISASCGEAVIPADPQSLLAVDLKNQVQTSQPYQGALFEALSLILKQNKNDSAVKNAVADVLRVFSALQQLPRTAETVSSHLSHLSRLLAAEDDPLAADRLQRLILLSEAISRKSTVPPANQATDLADGSNQPAAAKELVALSHALLQSFKSLAEKNRPSSPEQRLIQGAEKALRRLEVLASAADLPQTLARLAKVLGESPQAVALLQNSLAETAMTPPVKTSLEQVLSLIAFAAEQNRSNENILALCDQSLRSIAGSLDSRIPLLYGLLPPLPGQAEALGELWIDPEDEGQGIFSRPGVRLLLSLEVTEIGHLEVEIKLQDKQVSTRFLCPPEHLASFAGFGETLGAAVAESGLTMGRLQVLPLSQPRRLDKIFEKNVAGRSGLNARA